METKPLYAVIVGLPIDLGHCGINCAKYVGASFIGKG